MNPTALAQKADNQFRKNGQAMTFIQENESEQPNPDTGQPEVETIPTEFYGLWDTISLQEIGTLIQVGDAVIWAGGLAIPKPDNTDWIDVDGEAWNIVDVEPTKPGSIPIVYKIYVRSAGSSKGYKRLGRKA